MTDHQTHHTHMVADFRFRFFVSFVLSVPVLALSQFFQDVFSYELSFPFSASVAILLGAVIYLYGGWPFLKGLVDELKGGSPGMMTLVGVAISVAFFYSIAVFFDLASGKQLLWELVTLVDVMLLGHWIEMRSVLGASRALEELARLLPSIAHRQTKTGELEDVSVDELQQGERIVIKPGEKIPSDGVVSEGSSFVNESMITGEAKPVEKNNKDNVIGGSVNGDGSLTITVTKTGDESYISQIIELVKSAQASRSRTQNLANTAAFWLTVVALAGGAVTFGSWLALASEFSYALERTIAVIVIACPHALGLAIPLVVSFSTSLSAQQGILIRDRNAFERARELDTVIFDKTGTLTKGTFQVSDIMVTSNEISEKELLSLAASVEAHSEHPIASAITHAGDPKRISRFQAIPGKGAEAVIDEQNVKVVSKAYCDGEGYYYDAQQVSTLTSEGKTIVFVIVQDQIVGVIGLDDDVRDEAREAVRRLRERGIRIMMITGDNEQVASRVARELGIDEYVASVLPENKSATLQSIRAHGRVVAMVGDGINDAPALAEADVGIAIGAGTDVALETADIILVKNNPVDVITVIDFSGKTYNKMIQNLWWAAGYNVVALPLAAGVLAWAGVILSPAVGAVLMSLSTVVVAVNASLLKL